jgi:hypothetical protein
MKSANLKPIALGQELTVNSRRKYRDLFEREKFKIK